MIKKISFLLLIVFLSNKSNAQMNEPHSIQIGIRMQKAAGFYWSNGITAEYTPKLFAENGLNFGMYIVSSKLGTAFNSNAIPVHEINLSAIKYFRNKHLFRPLVRLNLGYAQANYKSDLFNDIPNKSMISSLETGVSYRFNYPIQIGISGGYNFITGDGLSGLGTTFPFYAGINLQYKLK